MSIEKAQEGVGCSKSSWQNGESRKPSCCVPSVEYNVSPANTAGDPWHVQEAGEVSELVLSLLNKRTAMRQNLGQIGNQNSENKLFSPQMVLQKPRTQVKLYNC